MGTTYTRLLYHIVYSTKARLPLITEGNREDLFSYTGGIIRNIGGSLHEIGGMADHLHIVARLPADSSIASMVGKIKANSSKMLNEKYFDTRFEWQAGYGAFTVSPSQLDTVVRYVQTQAEHHSRRSFKEEFLSLLTKHGIEFDIEYVFD